MFFIALLGKVGDCIWTYPYYSIYLF